MLKLALPFLFFQQSVGTSCLPTAETLSVGDDLTATGWGIEGIGGAISDSLKEESINCGNRLSPVTRVENNILSR
jgi:hypothetical protein